MSETHSTLAWIILKQQPTKRNLYSVNLRLDRSPLRTSFPTGRLQTAAIDIDMITVASFMYKYSIQFSQNSTSTTCSLPCSHTKYHSVDLDELLDPQANTDDRFNIIAKTGPCVNKRQVESRSCIPVRGLPQL